MLNKLEIEEITEKLDFIIKITVTKDWVTEEEKEQCDEWFVDWNLDNLGNSKKILIYEAQSIEEYLDILPLIKKEENYHIGLQLTAEYEGDCEKLLDILLNLSKSKDEGDAKHD